MHPWPAGPKKPAQPGLEAWSVDPVFENGHCRFVLTRQQSKREEDSGHEDFQAIYKLIFEPSSVVVKSCVFHTTCFRCCICHQPINPQDPYVLEGHSGGARSSGASQRYFPYHWICQHRRCVGKGEYTISRPNPLVLGEPKSENQNNMLPCAWGEIINIMDMNQVCPGMDWSG